MQFFAKQQNRNIIKKQTILSPINNTTFNIHRPAFDISRYITLSGIWYISTDIWYTPSCHVCHKLWYFILTRDLQIWTTLLIKLTCDFQILHELTYAYLDSDYIIYIIYWHGIYSNWPNKRFIQIFLFKWYLTRKSRVTLTTSIIITQWIN